MLVVIIFTLFSNLSAFAQESKIQVIPLEKGLNTEALGKGFTHHPYPENKYPTLPSKEERDNFFDEYKISEKIKSWDELKKDIFYMDLKKKKLSTLQQKYPEFKNELEQWKR